MNREMKHKKVQSSSRITTDHRQVNLFSETKGRYLNLEQNTREKHFRENPLIDSESIPIKTNYLTLPAFSHHPII